MIRKAKSNSVVPGRPSKYDGMLRYKKIHGGIHNNRDGQVVRRGEILYAHDGALSELILTGFDCLDARIQEATGIQLGIKDRGNGWFDVINKATGEALNDEAMRAKDAKQFITGEIDDNIIDDEDLEDEGDETEDSDEDEESTVDEDEATIDLSTLNHKELLAYADENEIEVHKALRKKTKKNTEALIDLLTKE